jgi:hypothetical protein
MVIVISIEGSPRRPLPTVTISPFLQRHAPAGLLPCDIVAYPNNSIPSRYLQMQLGTWGPNLSVPQGVEFATLDFELEGRLLPDPRAAAHRPLAKRCRVAGPNFRVSPAIAAAK